jgi:carboxymethylenebutenolidase
MSETLHTTIAIATPDGVMPTHLHTPGGPGHWPAVVMLMDAPGIRPALQDLAGRLASHGFAVFLPDLFYRAGPYAPIDARKVFTDPALREEHRARFMTATTAQSMADIEALLDAIARHDAAQEGPVGVVGYCMGGRLALSAAGTFGARIGVMASYHGGGMATEKPGSPHRLAPRIAARVYVAGAIEDKNFDEEQKARLITALDEAGVKATVETYPAKHGWVPADMPAHNQAEAEHHWQTLVPLMEGLR